MSRMPLEGYRILDLTHWLVGGGATVLLADMGADVIKIESPSAPEPARNAPTSSRERELGLNHNLEITSRNKRSVTLNLKSDEGKQIFYKLVESADVVTENFRPGVVERLGIDHATLVKYNSSIILASVNGFGSQGPDALLGSFDVIGSACSGLLHLLSPPEAMRYVGPVAMADETGALVFCISILSALAARGIDGQGQHVETSQLAALLQLQTLPIHSYLFSGDYFRDSEVWPGNASGPVCHCSIFFEQEMGNGSRWEYMMANTSGQLFVTFWISSISKPIPGLSMKVPGGSMQRN